MDPDASSLLLIIERVFDWGGTERTKSRLVR